MNRWLGMAVLGALVLGVVGCSRDPAVAQLAQELRALRLASEQNTKAAGSANALTEQAGQAKSASEVRAAFLPLRGALQNLLEAQAEDRARLASLASDVRGVVAVMRTGQAGTDDARLAAIERRLAALETQAKAAAEDQALILGALELTVNKLDGFFDRVRGLASVREGERQAPAQENSLTTLAEDDAATTPGSGEMATPAAKPNDAAWWWGGIGVLGVAILSGFVWAGRRREERETATGEAADVLDEVADEPAEEPAEESAEWPTGASFAVTAASRDSAPELPPPATAAASPVALIASQPNGYGYVPGHDNSGDGNHGDNGGNGACAGGDGDGDAPPVLVEHEYTHPQPELLRELMLRWLASDPHVLAVPVPEIDLRRDGIAAHYHLIPEAARREGMRIESELAALARDTAGARGAAIPRGDGEGSGR